MRSIRIAATLALLPSISVVLAQAPTTEPVRRFTVPELVKEMAPSVVQIAALDAQGKPTSIGSGAVVRADGLVVTAYHVIQGAVGVQIKMMDGEIYDRVEVMDYDIRRDLVVLKVRPFKALPTLNIAEGDEFVVGEDVAAIGNPAGLDASVSNGIVSGRRQADGYQVIQTTAPVSRGSSGGPLFNLRGQVVGITVAQLRGEGVQNLNFAVPIAYVRPLLAGTGPPIAVADFTRKIAGSPLAAIGQSLTQNESSVDSISYRVLHDHGREFRSNCTGVLTADASSLKFASETEPGENWTVYLSEVAEVGRNSYYGRSYSAFHIDLRNRSNYNFIAVDVDRQAVDPGGVISAVERAVRAYRTQRK